MPGWAFSITWWLLSALKSSPLKQQGQLKLGHNSCLVVPIKNVSIRDYSCVAYFHAVATYRDHYPSSCMGSQKFLSHLSQEPHIPTFCNLAWSISMETYTVQESFGSPKCPHPVWQNLEYFSLLENLIFLRKHVSQPSAIWPWVLIWGLIQCKTVLKLFIAHILFDGIFFISWKFLSHFKLTWL